MAIDKIMGSLDEAVAGIQSGSRVMVSGFGGAGSPMALLAALLRLGVGELTLISNNANSAAPLIEAGLVRRLVCSFPRSPSKVFNEMCASGELVVELNPQGTLSERIRAGGAGIRGFYTPTGARTKLTENREHRTFDGVECVLETPLHAEVSLIRASRADRWGNLVYNKAGRNFGPSMAMAASVTIAEVREIVPLGSLDPEAIVTPGVFVQRVVQVGQ